MRGIARGLDALDIDTGQRLPEGARGVGGDEVPRLAVEGDDRHLRRAGLHDLEIALGDVGLDLGQKQRALGGELGAHDLHDLGREPAEGIDLGEAAGMKQTRKAAVAREECTLIVPDDNCGPQTGPVHHTTPWLSSPRTSGCILFKKGRRPPAHGDDTGSRLSRDAWPCTPHFARGLPEGIAHQKREARAWRRGGIRGSAERIVVCTCRIAVGRGRGLCRSGREVAGFPSFSL